MTFLKPLNALIPKIPFSFFAEFWVWVTSKARGSVSVGIWGSQQLSPFWGEGVQPERSIDPLPPRKRNPGLPISGASEAFHGETLASSVTFCAAHC